MPWNKQDYPVSMKNLEPRVRHKAIEIANALLDDGYEEGRSIAIATAKAEEWDENHPAPESSKSDSTECRHSEPVSSSKSHDNIHVVPTDSGWAIKEEGKSTYLSTFDTKAEAVDKAKELSKKQNIRAIIHNQDGQIASSIKP
ncbi:DUF2188 domain-containing protein [Paenibacillus sp. 2003]|uniref:DUF2188 domain-containing protein n=1 Tax=Paenibacillus TaxID=44249 RepID=UPI002861AC9B|nr:DUF2188 domain-containing protein [Paenibacillus sp. 2003]MDR6720542.1 uncharacterized protein YdaT [Paenibacillus sp. 2003]